MVSDIFNGKDGDYFGLVLVTNWPPYEVERDRDGVRRVAHGDGVDALSLHPPQPRSVQVTNPNLDLLLGRARTVYQGARRSERTPERAERRPERA